jgi:hypothetical protein
MLQILVYQLPSFKMAVKRGIIDTKFYYITM